METRLSGESIERFTHAFFGCIIIMLIPIIVKSALLPSANFTVLMAGAFVLQTCWYFALVIVRHVITISAVSAIFLINTCLAIFMNLLAGRAVNAYDFINLSVKILSLIFLIDAVTERKIRSEQLTRYATCMTFLSAIACAYNALLNFYNITMVFTTSGSAYAANIMSFFLNRNQFGMFLVVAFIVTDYAYIGRKSKTKLLIHLLQIVNIVFTLSRGAVLAIIAYCFVRQLIFDRDQKRFRRFTVFVIGLIFLTIAAIKTPQLNGFVTNKLLRIDAGGAGRIDVWLMGIKVFLNSPLNGVGTYTGLDIAIAQGFEFEQFHSFFIDTLVSGGIIELFVTLFIIIRIFRRCVRNLRGTEYLVIYKSSMIALLCMGCIESVSFFSMGYVDTLFTISFVTLPMLISNMSVTDYRRHTLYCPHLVFHK